MSWQPTGLTEVIVEARSDIGDTTIAGTVGALTRQVSVEIRHALRRHIILVAGASYAVANYGGTVPRETSTIEKLGFEYYLSRETAIIAGYQHTAFDVGAASPPSASRNFDDHTVRVGLRLRQ